MALKPEPKPSPPAPDAPTAPEVQAAPQEAAVESFETTLEDFCAAKSGKIISPELIGGFYSAQKRAGAFKALDSVYEAAFIAFTHSPA